MNSIILQSVARFFIPVQLAFSLFLLLRGHNEPGGGFAGGLVVAAAMALHAIAFSPRATRRLFRVEPVALAGVGLLVALLSGGLGLLLDSPYLTSQWIDYSVLGVKFGTPLMFDFGVYLLVLGMATGVLLSLMEVRE